MRWIACFLVLVPSAACGRAEEPHSRPAGTATMHSAPAASPKPVASAPTAPSEDRPPCVVPTPDTPPPAVKPASDCPPDPLKTLPVLPRALVAFKDAPGTPEVTVERAITPQIRSRGLMYRTSMDEDAGMLFSWESEEPRSFWMRNTCIPLDMLFIDRNGFIAGIIEQVPPRTDESRSNPCPVRHVLEVNAGYCRRHGIQAGQRIEVREE